MSTVDTDGRAATTNGSHPGPDPWLTLNFEQQEALREAGKGSTRRAKAEDAAATWRAATEQERKQWLADWQQPATIHRIDEHRAAPEVATIHLDDAFWTARPAFGHIRQAAHSRSRSAEVVLHCVLARVAGALPHTLKLPPVVGTAAPLCYFCTPVGPPGSGKSGGAGVAAELVPVPDYVADQLPVGSGEGIAEVLFDVVSDLDDAGKIVKVKRQVRHNAIVVVDEGEALTALGTRSGSTTLATYRSIWSGQTIGQTNASNDRKRVVPAGSYTFGLIVALQPMMAGALLDDVVAGTPQRFAWAWAIDPSIPDERAPWPGELVWKMPALIPEQMMAVEPAIVGEIRGHDLAVMRGEMELDIQEGHALLLRLKIAGLLAVIDGRLNIDSEDWALAGMVADTSRAVRNHVAAIVVAAKSETEHATSSRLARRQVEATTAVEEARIERLAEKIVRFVRAYGRDNGVSGGQITRALSARQRKDEEAAIALLVNRGDIKHCVEPGQGDDRRRYRPVDHRGR